MIDSPTMMMQQAEQQPDANLDAIPSFADGEDGVRIALAVLAPTRCYPWVF